MRTIRDLLEQFTSGGLIAPEFLAAVPADEHEAAITLMRGAEEEMLESSRFLVANHHALLHVVRSVEDRQIEEAAARFANNPAALFGFALNVCAAKHRIENQCNSSKVAERMLAEIRATEPGHSEQGYVYGVHDGAELLYVGNTGGTIQHRLRQHETDKSEVGKWIAGQSPESVFVLTHQVQVNPGSAKDYAWLRAIEKEVIKVCKPRLNYVGVRSFQKVA